jgi:hypothetical protein
MRASVLALAGLLAVTDAQAASCRLADATFRLVATPEAFAMSVSGGPARPVLTLAIAGERRRPRFRLERRPGGLPPVMRPLSPESADAIDGENRVIFLGPDLRTVDPWREPVAFAYPEGLWAAQRAFSLRTGRDTALPPDGLWRVAACRR